MCYSSLFVSLYILMQNVCLCIHSHAYLCDLVYMSILNKWCLSKTVEEAEVTRNCCYKNTASWVLSILIFIKQNSKSMDVIELWYFLSSNQKYSIVREPNVLRNDLYLLSYWRQAFTISFLNSERFSIVNKCQIALTYRFLFLCLAD